MLAPGSAPPSHLAGPAPRAKRYVRRAGGLRAGCAASPPAGAYAARGGRRGDAAALFDAAGASRLGWAPLGGCCHAIAGGRRRRPGPARARIREIFERADRLNYANARPRTDPDPRTMAGAHLGELRALELSIQNRIPGLSPNPLGPGRRDRDRARRRCARRLTSSGQSPRRRPCLPATRRGVSVGQAESDLGAGHPGPAHPRARARAPAGTTPGRHRGRRWSGPAPWRDLPAETPGALWRRPNIVWRRTSGPGSGDDRARVGRHRCGGARRGRRGARARAARGRGIVLSAVGSRPREGGACRPPGVVVAPDAVARNCPFRRRRHGASPAEGRSSRSSVPTGLRAVGGPEGQGGFRSGRWKMLPRRGGPLTAAIMLVLRPMRLLIVEDDRQK